MQFSHEHREIQKTLGLLGLKFYDTRLSAEQLQALIAFRDNFLPRSPNADPKTPNLINVFHGTKVDRLTSVVNGLVAVRSTDAGFFNAVTVGLRVPDNAIAAALLADLGEPLMSVTLTLPPSEITWRMAGTPAAVPGIFT